MPAMLIGLNKIPKILFMAGFATSLLSIVVPNNNSDPSLGSELGLRFELGVGVGVGLGSPSWWNKSWFENPL